MNAKKFDFTRSALLAISATLAACGGGGGGSSGGGSVPPPASGGSSGGAATGFTVGAAGNAAKGVISGATIDALEVTAAGLVRRGGGSTGSDGGFNVSLQRYTGGPILYRVTPGPNSMMRCDVRAGCRDAAGQVVPFGGSFPLPADFVMEGIASGVSQPSQLNACLSPLTHVAANRARELAGGQSANINADHARRALIELRLLTGGVDVGNLCAADLTNPAAVAEAEPEAIAHALFAAAALATTPGGNPTAALARLAAAFQGGVIAATDNDSTRLSLSEFVAAAVNEAEVGQIPLPDNVQLTQMNAQQAAAGNNQVRPCSTEPCGGTPAQANASEKARAVFGELREIFRQGERELTDPVEAFATELDAAGLAADSGLTDIGESLGLGSKEAFSYYLANDAAAGTTTVRSTDRAGTQRTATVGVVNNSDGTDTITLQGQVSDSQLDLRLDLPHAPQADAGTLRVALAGSARSLGASGVAAQLEGTELVLVVITNSEGDSIPDSLALNGNAVLEQFGVADPVSVTGTLAASILRCNRCSNSNLDLQYNPRLLAMTGRIANAQNNVAAGVRFDVDENSARSYSSSLPYSASNFVRGSVSINSQVKVGDGGVYNAVVSVAATGFDSVRGEATGAFTVRFSRNDRLYVLRVPLNIPVDMDAETLSERRQSLTLTTANGVVIGLEGLAEDDGQRITGTVTVDGVDAASVSETESGAIIIRYRDGVIESLG